MYRAFWGALASVLFAFPALAGEAGPLHLLKDLTQTPAGSGPNNYFVFGEHLYFTAVDPVYGRELWRSDGTTRGTGLFKDINPGTEDSSPVSFIEFGERLYFFAKTQETGYEIWSTDGTFAGTEMLLEIYPGPTGISPFKFVDFGGTLIFPADDGVHGHELWQSNGTAQGTTLLKDLNPGAGSGYSSGLFEVDFDLTTLLFFSGNTGSTGVELCVSDGTLEGTELVEDIKPGTEGSNPSAFAALDGTLYFSPQSTAATGAELWSTNGTPEGTSLVRQVILNGPGSVSELVPFNGKLYFIGGSGPTGRELWTSDGSFSGTKLLLDIYPGNLGSSPASFTEYNGALYFTATNGTNGVELWKTGGTAATTAQYADINPGPANSSPVALEVAGSLLYFRADDGVSGAEAWRTDGTGALLEQVDDLNPGAASSFPGGFTTFGSVVVFSGDSTLGDSEPYYTSTGNGATILRNVNPGNEDSYTSNEEPLSGGSFFIANTGEYGNEPWFTDGTEEGTFLLADCNPGTANGTPLGGEDAEENSESLGNQVIFTAFANGEGAEPWLTDGTTEGTFQLADIRPGSLSSSPTGYLATTSGVSFNTNTDLGSELTISTTAPSNFTVVELTPGNNGSVTTALGSVNGKAIYDRYHPDYGSEPVVSDGTVSGTKLLKDIVPGIGSSAPTGFGVANNHVFFRANEDSSGSEPWASDGTEEGTVLLADIAPGDADSFPVFLGVTESLCYFTAESPTYGREIWISDGTPEGTQLLEDFVPGEADDSASFAFGVGERLYFRRYTAALGDEMYFTEGTPESTRLVKDIVPGPEDANPFYFGTHNGLLFFVANTPEYGAELWRSDGTEEGTLLVQDLAPGITSASISSIFSAGGRLIITADDRVSRVGKELWYGDSTAPVVTGIVPTDLCPNVLNSLTFDVSFSTGVFNVDVTDFVAESDGDLGSLVIDSVQGSGSNYQVTVTTDTGSGNLVLRVADDNSIVDVMGNTLGGPDIRDGDFESNSCGVDRSAPLAGNVSAFPAALTNDNTTLSFIWNSFSDGESGIQTYTTSLGTVEDAAVYVPFLSAGTSQAITFTAMDYPIAFPAGLFPDGIYRVAVRATNGVGVDSPPAFADVEVDATPPGATLESSEPNPTTNAAFSVTIGFTEPVTGLELEDFVVSNGVASDLSGAGTAYAVTLTASAPGEVRVSLGSGAVTDEAGNTNGASELLSITYAMPEGEGASEGEGEGVAEGEPQQHSGDANGDGKIDLSELLRFIQLFNAGIFHCAASQSEDGFEIGPGDIISCLPHAGDYLGGADWQVVLSELLRMIQFYNLGGYHPCAESEDGFCAGP